LRTDPDPGQEIYQTLKRPGEVILVENYGTPSGLYNQILSKVINGCQYKHTTTMLAKKQTLSI
jgi:hypothetical protein